MKKRKQYPKLTKEEKARWAPMLRQTWDEIAGDAVEALGGKASPDEQIELTCDADRPVTTAGMTPEEYQVLCSAYGSRATRAWLKTLFPHPVVM